MTTTRSYQVVTVHPVHGRLGTQCRLQFAQAQQIARQNNAANERAGFPERYIVEAVRTETRMEAMPV